jgi:LysR family transcriptional regulator, transcriptional activator of the cysJI operon
MASRQLSSLDQLRVFVAVVEQGSFSSAGRLLSITQPGISKQVKALEKHFGVALFDRQRPRSRLTHPGESLYSVARDVLASIEQIEVRMREHRDGLTGQLSIGASMAIGSYVLPEIVASFQDRVPSADVRMHIAPARDVYAGLEAGVYDFCIGAGPHRPQNAVAEDLYPMCLVLFVAATHPLLRQSEIRIKDLERCRFVVGERGSPGWHSRMLLLQQHGIHPHQFGEAGHPEATKRLVAAGTDIGMLPVDAMERELQTGELVPIHVPGLEFQVGLELYHRPESCLTPLMSRFRDHLVHALAARSATQTARDTWRNRLVVQRAGDAQRGTSCWPPSIS